MSGAGGYEWNELRSEEAIEKHRIESRECKWTVEGLEKN